MPHTYTFVEYSLEQMGGIDCVTTIFLSERIRNVSDAAHLFIFCKFDSRLSVIIKMLSQI